MIVSVDSPAEDWICDRLVSEYRDHSGHEIRSLSDAAEADVIWILAPWCWRRFSMKMLREKKVWCTIHHEVPEKFDLRRRREFLERDSIVDHYHVPCVKTRDFIATLTTKPITVLPFWVNTSLWFPADKNSARANLALPCDAYIVGSFQRDTEGFDLSTPKLEKGPDRFCDYVARLRASKRNLHVLLGGWRRQYVIQRLRDEGIPFTYIERSNIDNLRSMYAALDLYVVASRYEGGPQSIVECAAMQIPIISSDVGIAASILPKNCIIDVDATTYDPILSDVMTAFRNVTTLDIRQHVEKFDDLMRTL